MYCLFAYVLVCIGSLKYMNGTEQNVMGGKFSIHCMGCKNCFNFKQNETLDFSC